MESRRPFALKDMMVVVTLACILFTSLSSVTGQDVNRCGPDLAKECYLKYKSAVWSEQFKPSQDGVYDEEEFRILCSRIKEKIPCHQYLADCPEAMNGTYRIQERGYEAMTNIVCNSKMLIDFYTAYHCQDWHKVDQCAKAMSPTSDPENPRSLDGNEDYCRMRDIEIACYEKTFNSSCPLPLKTAQTAVNSVVDAIAQLAGCPSSAHAVMVSNGFTVLLVAAVILSWLRT
ncbi:uncharacterized protein LOC119163216 [Rhipicephalus microplus]|uniref:uncharacterized protein LOC119163216 n=1 Tax=Rhipicephalus microplus TaxID=6941 RepID=UPI003F6AD9D3